MSNPKAQDRTDHEAHLTKRAVAEHYGKVSRTISRWVDDPTLGFPRPIMSRGRHYFSAAAIRAFDRRLVEKQLPQPAVRDGGDR